MKANYTIKNFAKRLVMVLAVGLIAVNAWGTTTYKLTQITSADDLVSNALYVFEEENGDFVIIPNVSSSSLQTTTTYSTSGLYGNETYLWKCTSTTGGWYLRKASDDTKYFRNSSSTTISFSTSGQTNNVWTLYFYEDHTISIDNDNTYRSIADNGYGLRAYPYSGQDEVTPTYFKIYILEEECSNSVTISKGTQTNCTFTLSKSGSQASCDGVSTTVTVSPSTGYDSPSVTQSGASAAPTITGSGNSWTVAYGANTTGTSTINVSCSAKTYTVTLNDNGGSGGSGSKTVTYNANANMTTAVTKPTRTHYDFGGYWTSSDAGTTLTTQIIDENGAWKKSVTGYTDATPNWIRDGGVTLYAKWTEHGLTNYRTVCCTDWSTPTVTYSSSLAINATEGVTIGSGTTYGAVSYASSDEDVLTVASDGTVTAVGAGTAHIVATWAGNATYCQKSANSNDITVSGIQVTGTTPVNFGQVYQNAVVANKTIYVTGLGLASAITPSLPGGSPFSFSPASLAANASNAALTISASTTTIGDYTQTLTLTSGSFSATVTVKMEVIAMPTATFVDGLHNLTEDANGVSLSNYNLVAAQGTSVVFPTLADQSKSSGTCEGEYYKFIGWTTSDNNTDPQDHRVTSYTLANGDAITYHAVWADGAGTATYTKLTSNSFSGTPAKYVLGAEYSGTTYYFSSYSDTDSDLSWGICSSSDAPIQFTLSGTAAALVAQDASGNYLAESSAKKKFRMSSTSATVELQNDGTIQTTSYYLRYNYNSGSGGLRFYETAGSEAVYFYLVGAAGTVHYRTSCCANKVDAPVVTASSVTSVAITLTWPDNAKATGWQIEWNGAGGWVSPSGTRTHTVTGLTPGTTYTWRVRATYEDPVCGADIASGSTTTNPVYHVTYAKGDGEANCSATGSTTDATGYEAGATVTLQSNGFTLVGHTFNAWTEDDEDITISSNQFTMPDHDVVITASWTAKVDKYFDRMHDQTDALHGGVAETSGTNEGKYYIPKSGCNYDVPTAVDSNTGDACQTTHYKLQGWIAASYVAADGSITQANLDAHLFSPTTTPTKTATGATYYAVWAEVTE